MNTPTEPKPKDSWPPRLYGGPDLIDEERRMGKWCGFEIRFKEDDTEYLSLAESEADKAAAVREARAEVYEEAANLVGFQMLTSDNLEVQKILFNAANKARNGK